MGHISTPCGQNAEFWYVKAGGTYSNHWALKRLIPRICGTVAVRQVFLHCCLRFLFSDWWF
jgi:hypothetical protein